MELFLDKQHFIHVNSTTVQHHWLKLKFPDPVSEDRHQTWQHYCDKTLTSRVAGCEEILPAYNSLTPQIVIITYLFLYKLNG